jgi:hypothetical protein
MFCTSVLGLDAAEPPAQQRVIVSRVRPRGSAQEGRGLVGFSCGRSLASACHRVSEGSVAICEEKPLTTLLVGAHTLGAHSAERYGRRSGRLNRLGGEPSCGFNKSLRCSFRRKPQGEEHRKSEACSARHRGRARSRSAEAISSPSALEGLPVCVRRFRSAGRALSRQEGAARWSLPAGAPSREPGA